MITTQPPGVNLAGYRVSLGATEIANSVHNSTVYSPLMRRCVNSNISDNRLDAGMLCENQHTDRVTTQSGALNGDRVARQLHK